MKLTKTQKAFIIRAYCVTKAEYTEKSPDFYYHQGLHAGLKISKSETEPDTVIVTRTDGHGKIRFRDRWILEPDGTPCFLSSNPADVPLSDIQVIKDLEAEIVRLKQEGAKWKEIASLSKSNSDTHDEDYIVKLKAENQALKAKLYELEAKISRKGKAGRKENMERKETLRDHIDKLIHAGMREKEICAKLGISRATFYRYRYKQKPVG